MPNKTGLNASRIWFSIVASRTTRRAPSNVRSFALSEWTSGLPLQTAFLITSAASPGSMTEIETAGRRFLGKGDTIAGSAAGKGSEST